MMSNPEVSYTRPTHPDKVPRPPPKSFTDFQSAADAARNPDSVKQSFIPKAGNTEPSSSPQTFGDLALSQADVRIGLLEQRIEQVENELEELTEAATKPAPSTTSGATFIAHMVRMAVVDGIVSPEAALLAIARELGLVDVTTKLQAPAASFRPPPVAREEARPTPPIKPRGAPVRERPPAASVAPLEEEEDEPVKSAEPPGKKYAGRPSLAMKKAQEAPRKAINALMAANGISQAKIERISGVPQGALSRWLRGGVTFDPNFIPKVEKAIKKLV